MKVRDAITELQALPPELELLDEYAENTIISFFTSTYGDESGDHDYACFETQTAP